MPKRKIQPKQRHAQLKEQAADRFEAAKLRGTLGTDSARFARLAFPPAEKRPVPDVRPTPRKVSMAEIMRNGEKVAEAAQREFAQPSGTKEYNAGAGRGAYMTETPPCAAARLGRPRPPIETHPVGPSRL